MNLKIINNGREYYGINIIFCCKYTHKPMQTSNYLNWFCFRYLDFWVGIFITYLDKYNSYSHYETFWILYHVRDKRRWRNQNNTLDFKSIRKQLVHYQDVEMQLFSNHRINGFKILAKSGCTSSPGHDCNIGWTSWLTTIVNKGWPYPFFWRVLNGHKPVETYVI